MTKVELSRSAYRSLYRLPEHIVSKLKTWIAQIEMIGTREVRQHPGFHDEPLKGKRKGQRSARLSRSYRVIYHERKDKGDHVILVTEVTKHEY